MERSEFVRGGGCVDFGGWVVRRLTTFDWFWTLIKEHFLFCFQFSYCTFLSCLQKPFGFELLHVSPFSLSLSSLDAKASDLW